MNLTELQQAVKDARERVHTAIVNYAVHTEKFPDDDDDVCDAVDAALTRYAALAGLERAIREVREVGGVRGLDREEIITALYAEAEKLMEVKA